VPGPGGLSPDSRRQPRDGPSADLWLTPGVPGGPGPLPRPWQVPDRIWPCDPEVTPVTNGDLLPDAKGLAIRYRTPITRGLCADHVPLLVDADRHVMRAQPPWVFLDYEAGLSAGRIAFVAARSLHSLARPQPGVPVAPVLAVGLRSACCGALPAHAVRCPGLSGQRLMWPVEETFELWKGSFGLDECQARPKVSLRD
jgi:hypothetical protein